MKAGPPCAGWEAQRSPRGEEAAAVHCFRERSEVASPDDEHSVVAEELGAGDKPTWEMACGCHESEGGRQCEGCWPAGMESFH